MRRCNARSGLARLLTLVCSTSLLFGELEPVHGNSSGAEAETHREDPSHAERVQVVRRGTSSRSARKAALAELPFDKLSPADRRRAQEVVRSISLFRELPTIVFEIDPDVYRFFTAHPDVAVSIWRAMDISQFQMWQTGPDEYEADAGDGTIGVIDVIYRADDQALLFCEGLYNNPLLSSPIRGRALIHLQTEFSRDAEDNALARHRVFLYVSFPSQTVETVAKLLSPVSNLMIDRNFREISLFGRMMSLAMERQPGWVEHTAHRLEGILEVRKAQLLKLTAQVYVAARKRDLARAGLEDISVDEVLDPLRKTGGEAKRREPDKTGP